MKPIANVATAFAGGFLAMWLLGRYVARAQAVVPARRQGETPDDANLRERVRARIGEWVSHPGAIDVDVQDGVVRVSGQVLAKELDGLLSRLTAVPGVRRVRNALDALHDPSGFGEASIPPAPVVHH